MIKKLVFIFLIAVFLLGACGPKDVNDDIAPDSRLATFRPVCYLQKHIGMWIYSRQAGAGDARNGFGFGMRMTEAEYAIECFPYE